MTALPAEADLTCNNMPAIAFSDRMAAMRNFLAGLLGTSGTAAEALAGLGALVAGARILSGAAALGLADRGRIAVCTGTWTLSLPAVADAGAGWAVLVRNAGSGTITIDPADSETVDGAATAALAAGRSALLVCTGAAWVTAALPGTAAGATPADAGSAAAPGLAAAADPDTGWLWPGADQLAAATGGVQRLLLSTAAFQVDLPVTGTAVQSAPTDATAGRLLTAGASATVLSASPALRVTYGGSANAIALTTGASISGAVPTGLMLRFRAGSANTGATTIAVDGGSAIACVTVTGAALPSGYIRTDADTTAVYNGTNWVVDRLAERGSNANGEYRRLADATQLCTVVAEVADLAIGTALLGGYRAFGQLWTFPAAFLAATVPSVAGSAQDSTGFSVAFGTTGNANTTWLITAVASQSAATRKASLAALGRWY